MAATLFALFIWVVLSVGCEDADEAMLQTVQCDSERGAGWQRLQAAIGVVLLVGGIGATVLAVRRMSVRPLAVAALGAVVGLVAIFQINDVELGDAPVPKLVSARVLEPVCAAPCADGVPIEFMLDRRAEVVVSVGPARYEDIGGRQYDTTLTGGKPADEGAYIFGKGRATALAAGRIVNPPAEAGPLPPGRYVVDIHAQVLDGGSQELAASRGYKLPFRIR